MKFICYTICMHCNYYYKMIVNLVYDVQWEYGDKLKPTVNSIMFDYIRTECNMSETKQNFSWIWCKIFWKAHSYCYRRAHTFSICNMGVGGLPDVCTLRPEGHRLNGWGCAYQVDHRCPCYVYYVTISPTFSLWLSVT